MRKAEEQRTKSWTARHDAMMAFTKEHPDIVAELEKQLDDHLLEMKFYFDNKQKWEVTPIRILLETLGYTVVEAQAGYTQTGPFTVSW